MPVWMGEGVVMPLPGLVGVPPTTPTHAYVPACSVRQSAPTPGFHFLKSSVEMGPLKKAMPSQLSPGLTLTNLLQLLTMPVWMGEGVTTPLDGLVGVPPPITPTHTYVPACSLRQSRPPTPVFQHEVLGRDGAVVERDGIACVAGVDLDELVTVADHALLGR